MTIFSAPDFINHLPMKIYISLPKIRLLAAAFKILNQQISPQCSSRINAIHQAKNGFPSLISLGLSVRNDLENRLQSQSHCGNGTRTLLSLISTITDIHRSVITQSQASEKAPTPLPFSSSEGKGDEDQKKKKTLISAKNLLLFNLRRIKREYLCHMYAFMNYEGERGTRLHLKYASMTEKRIMFAAHLYVNSHSQFKVLQRKLRVI